MRQGILAAACLAVSGCVAVPGAGPTTGAILDGASVSFGGEALEPFALVRMNDALARKAAEVAPAAAETGFPGDAAPPPFRLEPGDTVAVTIVSVDTNGFLDFAQSAVKPISTTDLPPQIIAEDGRIQAPPLGRVPASGLSPEALERRLTEALGAEMIEPSVVVQVADRQNARAVVLGRVSDPGSFPLLRPDLRLVDLIGLAGGPNGQVEDMTLSLTRGAREWRIPLSRALGQPPANIRVWPGDVVTIEGARRRFVAMGGLAAPGFYEFNRPRFTLADAMATSRGMENRVAARNGVFVYRPTPGDTLAALGAPAGLSGPEVTPTIYHFDFQSPTMMFAAQSFEMADGDVVYVSDSLIEEINKVFSLVTSVVPQPVQFIPVPE